MPENNKIKKMVKQEDFRPVEVPLTSDSVIDDEIPLPIIKTSILNKIIEFCIYINTN